MANFWSNYAVEPKRQHRWALYVNFAPAWIITKVKKPSWSSEHKEHPFLNHFFKFPGRIKWNEVSLSLVDPVDPDAAASVWQAIVNSGYNLPETEAMAYSAMVSKQGAVDALGVPVIAQLAPDPINPDNWRIVEEWALHNAFIKSVDHGELSYEGEDLSTIDLVLEYDYARLTVHGPAHVS
jgi:hypothetical protein